MSFTRKLSNDGLRVFVRLTPSEEMFWIAPPVHVAAEEHVPPFPATVRPAVFPVLSSTMPFAPPFAEMLRKASPPEPMFVF